MQDKQTLFDYLYKTLHEQIENGRFPYGSKLPSRSHLCETYNVGMRTVKDVLMRLKIEGYIQTQERKPTIVLYDSLHTHKDFELLLFMKHWLHLCQKSLHFPFKIAQMTSLNIGKKD